MYTLNLVTEVLCRAVPLTKPGSCDLDVIYNSQSIMCASAAKLIVIQNYIYFYWGIFVVLRTFSCCLCI